MATAMATSAGGAGVEGGEGNDCGPLKSDPLLFKPNLQGMMKMLEEAGGNEVSLKLLCGSHFYLLRRFYRH